MSTGERYGIEPKNAQVNGSFFIDELKGLVNFSSNISGKNVIIKYISDSLGTDSEMQVHKLAEEAMYQHLLYSIMSTRTATAAIAPQYKKQREEGGITGSSRYLREGRAYPIC